MRWFTIPAVLVALGLSGSAARADDKLEAIEKATKAGGLKGAKRIAGKLCAVVDLAELADSATTTAGEPKLKTNGSLPVREKTYFGVKYQFPKVTDTQSYTNTVLGREVPGRQVTVTITVDCDVDCRVTTDDFKYEWSSDRKTLTVTVPPIEVVGSVPDGREYDYTVSYGDARTQWLDSDDAKTFRKGMIRDIGKVARAEFKKGEAYQALRDGVKSELEEFIANGCPRGTKVVIQMEDK